MYVLGVHMGHDSSCALVRDGQVVAAAAEERFIRLKHYSLCPIRSLKFCLSQAGITMEDVDMIVIPTIGHQDDLQALLNLSEKSWNLPQSGDGQHDLSAWIRFFLITILKKIGKFTNIFPPLYISRYNFNSSKPVIHIEHHLAHAAAAYYPSGFANKTLVVTADGAGDGLSLTVWQGNANRLSPLLKVGREGSLGAFYSTVTEALGWWVGDGEGKTMGLAPYGTSDQTLNKLDFIRPHYQNGHLAKSYDWGFPAKWPEAGTEHWHFAKSEEVAGLAARYGPENIAYEAQRVLEEELVGLIGYWLSKTQVRLLAVGGGVFLNIKANQKIWETGLVDDFYIYPDAGDGGISVGAALYGYYLQKPQATGKQIDAVYFGPQYTDGEIEQILKLRNITYQKMSERRLISTVSDLLCQGKIIGWFQGRMEVGPRALGNRSILMDPRKKEHKDIINSRVKYREPFRPFCPSVIFEAKDRFFDNAKKAPFMIVSFNVKDDKRTSIPAVVHVDGTARPQMVARQSNQLFYELLYQFGQNTNTPVLLNTSFNVKGEPIVCSPQDAIRCFYDTGMDYLALGHYLVKK